MDTSARKIKGEKMNAFYRKRQNDDFAALPVGYQLLVIGY